MLSQQVRSILAVSVLLASCTQQHALRSPENPSEKFFGTHAEAGEIVRHQQPVTALYSLDQDCSARSGEFASLNYRVDKIVTNTVAERVPLSHSIFDGALPLSPGDLLALSIENGEGFNGQYIINPNGFLQIPHLLPIHVLGLPVSAIAEKLELSLVRAELFQPTTALVNLRLLQWSDIDVTVSGAVFEPGRVRINRKIPEQLLEQRINAFGDYSGDRMLSEALRAASGIRPDAKLDQVMLFRNGWQVQLDMSGVMTGESVRDIALVAGDRVVVPSTGCFQSNLVRPTQITPKGIRVFMSNLIDSAENNSAAAVGRFSSNMPYGSRLLQAAVSANCIGGKQWTNAPRKVLLASNNPLTGQTQVVERSVEQLIRQAHRTEMNPYLMPNDAIACYDSDVTNLRDIAGSLVDIISPFKLL